MVSTLIWNSFEQCLKMLQDSACLYPTLAVSESLTGFPASRCELVLQASPGKPGAEQPLPMPTQALVSSTARDKRLVALLATDSEGGQASKRVRPRQTVD